MTKVRSQDIPAEDAFAYSGSLRAAVNHPTLGRKYNTFKYAQEKYGYTFQSVQERYPFKQPYKKNISKHSPTVAQRAAREIFSNSYRCFNAQPNTGGVTPPVLGPRNREFWYTSSLGSGLFYYDYFMRESLSVWYGGGSPSSYPFNPVVPDWCQAVTDGDTTLSSILPNSNFGNDPSIQASYTQIYLGSLFLTYALVHSPVVGYSSLVLKARVFISMSPSGTVTLKVYKVSEPWGELTATWNNQPAITDEIGSIVLSDTTGLPDQYPEITIPLSGDAVDGVELRLVPDPVPTQATITFLARSLQYGTVADRPKFIF